MERLRKPLQGVTNIIRFNWHFYAVAAVAVAGALLLVRFAPTPYADLLQWTALLAVLTTGLSLAVSLYVYDLSNLYSLNWLPNDLHPAEMLNIHAGFDETSVLLQKRFPEATLRVFDFYNPQTHTEVSIKRARWAYPPYPNTQPIGTNALPVADASADMVFLLFAAHEIRDNAERVRFFRELHRVMRPGGRVIIAEHLRDLPNFLAYTIGFFHFLPRSVWYATFRSAGFTQIAEAKVNPFVTSFTLTKP